jgi:hypothetical protein
LEAPRQKTKKPCRFHERIGYGAVPNIMMEKTLRKPE